MTFTALLSSLEPFDATAPLVFKIDDRIIGAGYHVTELRHSMSTGIDCGGNVDRWQEARLQLLDGTGDTHMSVGKFRDIVTKSLGRLPELAQIPLLVEFAPDNAGLKLMLLEDPVLQDGQVTLRLRDSKAVCKPAQRNGALSAPSDACCGVTPSASACCGSNTPPTAPVACCA